MGAEMIFFFLCRRCQGGWGSLCPSCQAEVEEEEKVKDQDE